MAAARHLRSSLPLLRAHLAASESAAVAQVPLFLTHSLLLKQIHFCRFRLVFRVLYPI
jgi:hypothetical protein